MLGTALAAASALACQPAAAVPVEAAARGRVVFLTERGEIPVQVEIADTREAQARGLMDRRTLGPWDGMLFVFPDERPRTFWMKNTYIPLDMIFLDAQRKVIGVVADAAPLTLESRSVPGASQYVVEVNAGFCAEHGIGPGTSMRIELPEGRRR